MEHKEVYHTVCEVIENSTGISVENMRPDATLFDELALDSIDLVDVLYELELRYSVELRIGDIEKSAMQDLNEGDFQVDGKITREGLDAIRKHMPELAHDKLQEGMTMHELAKLFNVASLCRIVESKLNG